MQAVILAAGKSTRMYPLTLTRPKPLLKVANKTILEHDLDNLTGFADEAIIIVGYKKEMIKKCFGNNYKNIKLKYVEQKEQLGTGHAASLAEPCIKDRFILMAGDDIYSKNDIKNCAKHQYSILTARTENPEKFGVVIEKKGILIDFIEKPKKFISNSISTSFYTFDKKIFHYIRKIKKSERHEFELPDAIKLLSRDKKVYCIKSKRWLPIGHPLDLLKADKILRNGRNIVGINTKTDGKIENSSIGNNCIISGNVKNSIIMDGTIVDKSSLIENSIIGENAYFSGRASGCVVSDNVKAKNVVARNCSIWPNKSMSNMKISKDFV